VLRSRSRALPGEQWSVTASLELIFPPLVFLSVEIFIFVWSASGPRLGGRYCFQLIFVPAVFSLVRSPVASPVWGYLLMSRIRALSFIDQGSDL
jgi:hypothetical protein